jgi:hypothetical protein
MTTPSLLGELDTTVQELRLAKRHSEFTHKLAHVVTAIGAIPDLPPQDFTDGAMARLRELADEAVDAIERRIDSDAEGGGVPQQLAGTVYEIRRRMEVVETWFRHFAKEP